MFGVYDYGSKDFISVIDCCGWETGGTPILFSSKDLAEAFLIWFLSWNGFDDDDDQFAVVLYVKKKFLGGN